MINDDFFNKKTEQKFDIKSKRISMLNNYGENFQKNEYITNPAIGRDQQIKELILILLTPDKSAVLIGKPGVGVRQRKRHVPGPGSNTGRDGARNVAYGRNAQTWRESADCGTAHKKHYYRSERLAGFRGKCCKKL